MTTFNKLNNELNVILTRFNGEIFNERTENEIRTIIIKHIEERYFDNRNILDHLSFGENLIKILQESDLKFSDPIDELMYKIGYDIKPKIITGGLNVQFGLSCQTI